MASSFDTTDEILEHAFIFAYSLGFHHGKRDLDQMSFDEWLKYKELHSYKWQHLQDKNG